MNVVSGFSDSMACQIGDYSRVTGNVHFNGNNRQGTSINGVVTGNYCKILATSGANGFDYFSGYGCLLPDGSHNCEVAGSSFEGNYESGISPESAGAGYHNIHDNTCDHNGADGIDNGYSSYNTIKNNDCYSNGFRNVSGDTHGILLWAPSGHSVTGNVVEGNTSTGNGYGAGVCLNDGGGGFSDNTVKSNTLEGNGNYGVFANGGGAEISYNTFRDNPSGAIYWMGDVYNSDPPHPLDNYIHNNTYL